MNHEEENKTGMTAGNRAYGELLARILRAEAAEELHRLAEHDVLDAAGLSEAERLALEEAVTLQFCALNAAALEGKQKPRWT
jgi:hypothetical protein